MSIIAADTIKSRVAGAAVTTTGGLYVGGACTSISLNVTGIATIGVGLSFADSVKASFGNSNDLQIYHDASNAFIANNGSGDFYIQGGNVRIRNVAGSADLAQFVQSGKVALSFNGSEKFETHNTGVKVTGIATITDSAIVGSGVTINSTGIEVTSGIVTAGTCLKAGGGTFGPGIGATILGSGDAVLAGVVTATTFVPTVGQLSHRNLMINGAMQVAQRGTSTTTTGDYTADRYRLTFAGTDEAPTMTQHALTSSDTGPWAAGFRYSTHITNGNQTSGAGAADSVFMKYKFEAQDLAQSGWDYNSTSSYVTLSFWVQASVAQNYYGYIVTDDGTQQNFPFETGSLTADTWKKVTVKIPGNSGITITNDNTAGLAVHLLAFLGTDQTASGVSLNTWAAFASGTRTPDNTSTWYTTDDATFEFTGFQLEVGSVATPFEHRSYGEELTRCQRYYQRWNQGYLAGNSQGSDINIGVPLTVPLRAAPTVAALDMHRSGNQSVTVGIVGAYYTDLTSTVLRVRTSGWTSMVDETVYTVQPNSDTMEMSAEL